MILNTVQPLTLVLLLVAALLLIFLGHELKKSYITAIPLAGFVLLLLVHVFEMLTVSIESGASILIWCIITDCGFILLSLLSYLWVDDIDAKAHNKKSVDNSLNWFWKEV